MGIPIYKQHNVMWDGLTINFYFNDDFDKEIYKELKEIISSWYILGVYEGFGGKIHNMSEIWYKDKMFGFSVDMGSAEQSALEVLFCSIEGFSEVNELILEKVEIK